MIRTTTLSNSLKYVILVCFMGLWNMATSGSAHTIEGVSERNLSAQSCRHIKVNEFNSKKEVEVVVIMINVGALF